MVGIFIFIRACSAAHSFWQYFMLRFLYVCVCANVFYVSVCSSILRKHQRTVFILQNQKQCKSKNVCIYYMWKQILENPVGKLTPFVKTEFIIMHTRPRIECVR